MDAMLESETGRAGDILVGRFKALEESIKQGKWHLAQQLEAMPQAEEGLVDEEERHRATSLQLRTDRRESYLETHGGAPSRGSRG